MLHRHATDVIALVCGTVFAGVAITALLTTTEAIDVQQAWIGGPVILIIAGVLGLVVTLTPSGPASPAPLPEPDDSTAERGDDEAEPTTPL